MKRTIDAAFAAVLALFAACAGASSYSSEITDMWWNPDESGWGVNVILQKDVGFITFFVYDSAQNPVWYTSDVHFDQQNGLGTLVWKGSLYATKGPWFGGRVFACNPASLNKLDEQFGAIAVNQAGSRMTLVFANSADTCNFAGDYSQTGKLGQVAGTYSCAGGVQGTFVAYEMTPTISGFTARVRGQNQYCQWQGFLGGIRRSP